MVLKSLLLIYNLAGSPTLPFFQRCSYLICPAHAVSQYALLCNKIAAQFIAGLSGQDMWSPPFPPCCWSAEEIESNSCVGVMSALFFLCHPALGQSAAGAAIRWVRGHTVVLFWEKSLLCCQVAVVGGDSYGFVLPPRVTASAASLTPPAPTPTPT